MPNQTANQPRPPVSAKMRKRKRQRAEQAGRLAEWKIRWLLWCKGYRLIHRRWRCVAGEIDLILRRRNLLVFAEVKYRQHRITDRIIRRISNSASQRQQHSFWRRTNGSQPLIADLTSLPLSRVHALALARLRISIMRGNLLQMTLTDSSQSVTLRASKPSD